MPKGTYTSLIYQTMDEAAQQRLDDAAAKIHDIMYGVFPMELWPLLKSGTLMQDSFFDVKTGGYIGGHFIFDVEIKDIVTLDKIYEMEQKLEAAHLNVGKQQFKRPNKKYFDL